MAFEDEANEPIPGSPGGVIEAAKRGVIVALRTAISGTSLSAADSQVHVDLEYPATKELYPGIWVQFSLSRLRNAGIGMMDTAEDGSSMQQFAYEGRVTLTVVALTSIERDRIADFLISALAFSRIANPKLYTENGMQEVFTDLYEELDRNPHLSMTVNSDEPRPGGQSVNVGVPWDPAMLAYEDAYSFDVVGQFTLVRTNDGFYRLERVDILPEIDVPGSYTPGTWV